jgi:hypothetical protein
MSLRILLLVVFFIITLATSSFAQNENMKVLVKVQDKAPDGTTIATISQPSINNNSEAIFLATDNSTPRLLLAKDVFTNPKLELLIDRSTPIVGLNGAKVFRAIFPKSNDNGDVLFAGSFSNLPIDGGLFLYSQGEVRPVALAKAPSPTGGTLGIDLPLTSFFSLNNRQDIVFMTSDVLTPTEVKPTIFLIKDKVLSKVISDGDTVPNIGKIKFTQNTVPAINENGEILFSGTLEENPMSSNIYLVSNGTIKKIVGSGDKDSQGSVFEQVFTSGRFLNNKGEILFIGRVSGKDGIYLFSPVSNSFTTLIAVGDPSPDGGTFSSLGIALTPSHGRLTDKGNFVFRSVTTKTRYGLFFYKEGKILKIVGQRDPTPLGGVFADEAIFNAAFLGSIISNKDEIIFEALIKGGSASKALIVWSDQAITITPKIVNVVYDKKAKLLKINASNINGDTKVEINGKLITLPIKITNGTELSLTGKRKQLNLNKKVDSNKLILISGDGVRSTEFSF